MPEKRERCFLVWISGRGRPAVMRASRLRERPVVDTEISEWMSSAPLGTVRPFRKGRLRIVMVRVRSYGIPKGGNKGW